jgi:L-lactate dehydrogenase (cytochrome)
MKTLVSSFGNVRQKELYDGMHHSKSVRYPISFEEWEAEAKRKLDTSPYDYVAGGAGSEETVRANRLAFENWRIRPEMLKDISERNLCITLYGETFPAPIMLAPIGVQTILHPEGELASAKAARECGVPFIASTASSNSMEEIAEVLGTSPKWFQLYWNEDHNITKSFVKRAEMAGYSAIVITLDTNITPWRERDLYNAYLPFLIGEGIGNYVTDPVFCQGLQKPPHEDMDAAIEHWGKVFGNPRIKWKDVQFIREQTNLPILLKGVLHPNDAKLALNYGVDGIIVSNHGGRQVDGSVTALDALPEIADAIQNRVPVLMDSGVRRGSDVLKAIALGADSVLIGRPFAYGLAVA